ncbi:MAG: response regulator [Lacibacter sp.]
MLSNNVEILLAEDNINDAELTIRELKRHNLVNEILHVKDGEEALEYIFGRSPESGTEAIQHPKLILLDIKMPKIDGIEVLKKIKTNESTQSIPVVMLTSSKEDPDIKKCYDLGANSYIVKPVNFEDFAAAIRSIHFYWLLLNELPNK